MRTPTLISALIFGLLASFSAWAEEQVQLQDVLPSGLPIVKKAPSQVEGVSMVELGDGTLIYLVEGKPYFFIGELFDFSQGNLANLSEAYRRERRAEVLADLDPSESLVFAATGPYRGTLWVFTDVTCGYCQLFHRQIADYNELGLEIRYLAFPRFGLESESRELLETAWCSDDPQAALTLLKSGEELPAAQCENPVEKHFVMAQRLGVDGTPAIFLRSGKKLAGYVPPDQILSRLGLEPAGQ